MYRCGICGACSEPGQPRKVWVVERRVPHTARDRSGYEIECTRTEIEREIPVCHGCYKNLEAGVPLEEIHDYFFPHKNGPTELDEWPEEVGRKGHR